MLVTITLDGRPVFAGTKLTYRDEAAKEMWGDEYLVVTEVSSSSISYEGTAGEVEGRISAKELPNVFQHYKEEIHKSNEYVIAHIADLLTIPDDRLDACLDGLKVSIRAVSLSITTAIVKAEEEQNIKFTEEDKRLFVNELFGSVTWLDDGDNKNEVRHNGETVLTVTSN